MCFGDVLRRLLDERDLTQKQLAATLNVSATTISNYVRGLREPDLDTLRWLAAYFKVSTDHLLSMPERRGCAGERELLHLYRLLSREQQSLFLEQGKLLVRMQKTRELSCAPTSENAGKTG